MTTELIFVYGTLRTNARNWTRYLAPQCGRAATTSPNFTMRRVGSFERGYPVLEAEGTTAIHGEVFEVDSATLESIDQLEGHPTWYQREMISVRPDDNTEVEAWIYLMPKGQYPTAPLIESGNWLAPDP